MNLEKPDFEHSEEHVRTELLKAIDNLYKPRCYQITLKREDFESICPFSKILDKGTVTICYEPRDLCIEILSLKEYLASYKELHLVQEVVVNKIFDDIMRLYEPKRVNVKIEFVGGSNTPGILEVDSDALKWAEKTQKLKRGFES